MQTFIQTVSHTFDPFKVIVSLICVNAIILPLVLFLSTTDLDIYFNHSVPPGQFLYVCSKLSALMAISLFCLQLTLKNLSIAYPSFANTNNSHRLVGLLTLASILLHVFLFASAVFIRSDHIPIGLFTFRFSHGYYNLMVTLGLIGFIFMVLAVSTIVFFKKFLSFSKDIHYQSMLFVYVLVLIHSLTIGTETRLLGLKYWYLATVMMPIIAIGIRCSFRFKRLGAKS